MSKYLQLQIPKSCHQNWHAMLPEEQGRFCQSCQKKVVDFTAMSDRELARFFAQTNGPVCGRFTKEQLNKDLLVPNKPLPWIKYFIQATLPAFLLSLKASAQISKAEQPVHLSPVQRLTENKSIIPTTIDIEGIIQDEQGNSIPHATIMLKGTNRGVQADSAGRFAFPNLQAPATLVISSVGYLQQEVPVHAGQTRLQLKMQLHSMVLGEVVTVGYVAVSRHKKKNKIAKADIMEEKTKMSMYPNPLRAGGVLNFQCKKLDYGTYSLELYNTSGAQVHTDVADYTKGMNRIQMQTPQIPVGHYFIKLTHQKKGTTYTEQVIVTL